MARCLEQLLKDDLGEATTAMGRGLFHLNEMGESPLGPRSPST